MFQNCLCPPEWKVPDSLPGRPSPGPRQPLGSSRIPGSCVAPRTDAKGMRRRRVKDQILSSPTGSITRWWSVTVTRLLVMRGPFVSESAPDQQAQAQLSFADLVPREEALDRLADLAIGWGEFQQRHQDEVEAVFGVGARCGSRIEHPDE